MVESSKRAVRPTSLVHKAVVAGSGVALSGFMLVHTAGVLTVFAGPETMNGYAALLRSTPLLWVLRVALALLFAVHLRLALALFTRSRRARGATRPRQSAARRLRGWRLAVSGALLGAWAVYHVLHVYGLGQASYVPGDVHHNLVRGLASPLVAASYLVASALLAWHCFHGAPSTLHSLGVSESTRRRSTLPLRVLVVLVLVASVAPVLASLLGVWD